MDKDIEALVKTTIQAKIVEAFNEAPEAIDKLVAAALGKEVDEHGMKPDFRSGRRMGYLEWLVGEEIRQAARQCVREHVEANKTKITAKIADALAGADVGQAVGAVLAKIMEDEYRWTFSINADGGR